MQLLQSPKISLDANPLQVGRCVFLGDCVTVWRDSHESQILALLGDKQGPQPSQSAQNRTTAAASVCVLCVCIVLFCLPSLSESGRGVKKKERERVIRQKRLRKDELQETYASRQLLCNRGRIQPSSTESVYWERPEESSHMRTASKRNRAPDAFGKECDSLSPYLLSC